MWVKIQFVVLVLVLVLLLVLDTVRFQLSDTVHKIKQITKAPEAF